MNDVIKRLLLLIPSINNYVDHVRKIRTELSAKQVQIDKLMDLIEKSRSAGLFGSAQDFLTERLLAHPVTIPCPEIKLASQEAQDKGNRIHVADRLIRSYHRALEEEKRSTLQREGEDLWTGLIRNELPELMEIIEHKDPERLAKYLMNFGQSFVWYGGITTCVDGYNRNIEPSQVALTYFDKLACLAEFLGILRVENPESGPWGENLHVDANSLVNKIEKELGFDISSPMGIIHTDGLLTERGIFHYRHINSLYMAARLGKLNQAKDPVCEFGGGLGMTAMYARRMGQKNYTILDLPITCLLAGHYLIHAIGEEHVTLYGETLSENSIKILPYWECLNIPSKYMGMTINQDSLPEISDNLIVEYLKQINRITKNYFLSINHECSHPRTVFNFVQKSAGYEQIYRSKCWVREGYVEEAFRIL